MDAFDSLINKASGVEEFGMRDEDWGQLESMLNARDRRRVLGWIWRGALALLIGLLALFLVTQDSVMDERGDEVDYITNTETSGQRKALENQNSKGEMELLKSDNAEGASNASGISLDDSIGKDQALTLVKQQGGFNPQIDEQWTTEEQAILAADQALANGRQTGSNQRNEEVDPIHGDKEPDATQAAIVSQTESGVSPPNTTLAEDGEEGGATNDVDEELGNDLSDQQPPTQVLQSDSAIANPLMAEAVSDATTINPLMPEADSAAVSMEPELAESAPTNVEDVDSAIAASRARRWHVYAGAGTDWSSATRGIGPTKFKLQAGGEYLFLKRLSVLSGVNYTVKTYETNTENYSVEQGFWTDGIQPNSISAECNVFDIPLNLRYYFTPQDSMRSSFYIMAGASSWLMASERYSFSYDVNDPALRQAWSGEWENIHYFSVLNLSAGYQKCIRPNWSLLLEPYVNVPLTGIGFAEVDLISFGLSLQLKY